MEPPLDYNDIVLSAILPTKDMSLGAMALDHHGRRSGRYASDNGWRSALEPGALTRKMLLRVMVTLQQIPKSRRSNLFWQGLWGYHGPGNRFGVIPTIRFRDGSGFRTCVFVEDRLRGCCGFFVSAFAAVKTRDSDRSCILCGSNAGFQICFDHPDDVFYGRAMTILVRATRKLGILRRGVRDLSWLFMCSSLGYGRN